MKRRNPISRIGAFLLAAAIAVSVVPQLALPAFAADGTNEKPTASQFMAADELKTFNTDDAETDTQKASPATEVVAGAPVYSISVDRRILDFGVNNEGFGSMNSEAVRITNTGNSKVTLEMPYSPHFKIHRPTVVIRPDQSVFMYVTPKTGLMRGTYNEVIKLETIEGATASVYVAFVVNYPFEVSLSASATSIVEGQSATLTASAEGGSGQYSYTWYVNDVEDGGLQGEEVTVSPAVTTTYKVMVTDTIENKSAAATITVIPRNLSLEVPANHVFETQHVGYEDAAAHSFDIRNTGNVDVSNINVALTGTNADAFVLDTSAMEDALAPGEFTSISVQPNAGLEPGEYAAQIEITADEGIAKTTTIGFTVEGHKHESVVTAPTCTTKGYTTHTCTICGHSYTDSETDMLPHEYREEWVSNETSHWHECDCGAKSDDAEHVFKEVVDKPATQTETGSKHEECTVCGYEGESVVIPVLTPTDPDNPDPDNPDSGDSGDDEPGQGDSDSDKPSDDSNGSEADRPDVDNGETTTNKPSNGSNNTGADGQNNGANAPGVDKLNNGAGIAKTSDQTNAGLFICLLSLSAACIAIAVALRKKKAL